MRHLADEPLDRVARQARVGVERDDITDVDGQRARSAVDERRIGSTTQETIELMELAALALPSIQTPCASFQTRCRCNRRKRSAPSAFG